jgi:hypothetical protein
MLQRTLPAGFIAPCLPTTDKLPSGWLHEIKHGGFRIIAWRDGPRVRLYSRPGNDLNAPLSADRRNVGLPSLALLHHRLSPAMTTASPGCQAVRPEFVPVVSPSTVARVEGLVGRRHLPGATNVVEAVKGKGLHQINRPIA